MKRERRYSLSRQTGWAVAMLLSVFAGLFGYQRFLSSRDAVYQEHWEKLEAAAMRFESELSAVLSSVMSTEGDPTRSRAQRISAVSQMLQPVVGRLTSGREGIRLGYYSKSLDSSVAVAPLEEIRHLVGRTIEPDHPARSLYSGAGVQRDIGTVEQGRVVRYARLVFWEGKPVGHIFATVPIRTYYLELIRHFGVVGIGIISAAFIGVFCSVLIARWIKRAVDALGAGMEVLADNPLAYSPDSKESEALPEELRPLLERFHGMSERLHESIRELSTSARMAALGDMVSVVVHEVRNPTCLIRATAQLGLLAQTDEKLRSYFQRIMNACDGVDQFVQRTLLLARSPQSSREVLCMSDVIGDLVAMSEPLLAEKGVQFETDVSEGLPAFDGDRIALGQALMNLLRNAAEATPSGGKITLSVRAVAGGLEVALSDTGNGIPEEFRDRIFQRFFTTKGNEGTGIGLALVHSVVAEHDGKIWFDSVSGKGTTFFIQLPAEAETHTA